MATATVDGLTIAYEVIGDGDGRPWAITPGGRFSKDDPGVRELAEALAAQGNRVLIWDRPNCGASDVCFTGASESAMQADVLEGLLGSVPGVISRYRRLAALVPESERPTMQDVIAHEEALASFARASLGGDDDPVVAARALLRD